MVVVLEREMYTVPEAARLLRVPASTLTYWLEGGTRRGKVYRPVLRPEPLGKLAVTWAEFVEAGLLSQYRRHQVPMVELRMFIDSLRDGLGVPYPLADRRPYMLSQQLVHEAQITSGLGIDYCLVHEVSGQLILAGVAEAFLKRVEWDGDVAAGWKPDPDPESAVRVNPNVRFGRPSVNGISTEVIWELEDGGEAVEEIAQTYGLTIPEIDWALSYEHSQRAAQARRAA